MHILVLGKSKNSDISVNKINFIFSKCRYMAELIVGQRW